MRSKLKSFRQFKALSAHPGDPVLAGPIGHGFQVEGPEALAAAGQPSDMESIVGDTVTGSRAMAGPSRPAQILHRL